MVRSIMSGNNFDDSALDPEKLKEAYRKVDELFGIPPREFSGKGKRPASRNTHRTNRIDSSQIKPYLLACLTLFSILILVLITVYLDDIYLLFNLY